MGGNGGDGGGAPPVPPPPAQWAYGEQSLLQYDGALLQFASCMEGVAQYAYALHVEQYEGAFEQSAPEEHEHCPVNVIVASEVP